jgi:hypothetical protein
LNKREGWIRGLIFEETGLCFVFATESRFDIFILSFADGFASEILECLEENLINAISFLMIHFSGLSF